MTNFIGCESTATACHIQFDDEPKCIARDDNKAFQL
jgi:hypothetical protein